MEPTNNTGRLAGIVYILMGLVAPFGLLYMPRTLIVRGNPAATAANIRSSEMLFRLGMVAELTAAVIFVILAMVLYRLFNKVDRMQAALMVIFALCSVPVAFLVAVDELAALTLVKGADYLAVFSKPQIDALALFFLGMRGKTILVNQIFWGLWLFPFGVLVIRSRFMPRFFGYLLLLNGLAYVLQSLTGMIVPEYAAAVDRFTFVAQLGELWIMFWLIIKGVKVQPAALSPVAA